MDTFDWTIAILTFISVMLIPGIVLLIRGAMKWNSTESQIKILVDDTRKLVESKEKDHAEIAQTMQNMAREEREVHNEIIAQLRNDRDATDKRLRFIEEYWMKRGQG
jgi:hypothetical protein